MRGYGVKEEGEGAGQRGGCGVVEAVKDRARESRARSWGVRID